MLGFVIWAYEPALAFEERGKTSGFRFEGFEIYRIYLLPWSQTQGGAHTFNSPQQHAVRGLGCPHSLAHFQPTHAHGDALGFCCSFDKCLACPDCPLSHRGCPRCALPLVPAEKTSCMNTSGQVRGASTVVYTNLHPTLNPSCWSKFTLFRVTRPLGLYVWSAKRHRLGH